MKYKINIVLLVILSCIFIQVQAQYSTTFSPNTATVNDKITITFSDFDCTNDFYTCGQEEVYLYAGVETSVGTWQYTIGTFSDPDTQAAALSNCANSTFYLSLCPASYFNIPSGTLVKGINLVFVNQFGGGGNNQTMNQYIDLVDAVAGDYPNTSLSPVLPNDNQSVTLDFDATGTALAGASKVYLHSGVSTRADNPASFDAVVGNWGQDDGIGEMTNVGGNMWQITLPSLRTYYGLSLEDDIFGLNYLFRNETGTVVEANNGSNYFNNVATGNYISLDAPSSDNVHLAATGVAFATTSSATTAPINWTLQEVDASNNPISTWLHKQVARIFLKTLHLALP